MVLPTTRQHNTNGGSSARQRCLLRNQCHVHRQMAKTKDEQFMTKNKRLLPHLMVVSVGQASSNIVTFLCASFHPSTINASTHLHRSKSTVRIEAPSSSRTLGWSFRKPMSSRIPRTSRHNLRHRVHTAATDVSSDRVSTSPSTIINSSSGSMSTVADVRPHEMKPRTVNTQQTNATAYHSRKTHAVKLQFGSQGQLRSAGAAA